MTKRVRGTARPHHRPGTRPPSERSATRRRLPGVEASSRLEAAEEIAQNAVEERPARATQAVEQVARQPVAHPRHRPKPGSLLAERAANEYVYVAQDMRRILIVSAVLVAILIALWLVIVVLRVIELPFY